MEKHTRFVKEMGISSSFADVLVSDKARAEYFESAVKLGQGRTFSAKMVADLMVNKKMDSTYPEPAGLIKHILEITSVAYSSNDEVENAVKSVLMENEKAVKDYKSGNGNVVGFLIGMTQKKLVGKGNPTMVREKIMEELQK